MTLTDTGALVALIDSGDAHHERCLSVAGGLILPFVTTLACFTEAMYLLARSGGYKGQAALWEYRRAGVLQIVGLSEADLDKAEGYMADYRDAPCDFADASLLAVADREHLEQIFTVDGHFYSYRLHNRKTLIVIPGPRR